MVSRPWPCKTMVMAVLLEHEKRIEHFMRPLEQRVPRTESWHSEKKKKAPGTTAQGTSELDSLLSRVHHNSADLV
jgi:hypothetical protein